MDRLEGLVRDYSSLVGAKDGDINIGVSGSFPDDFSQEVANIIGMEEGVVEILTILSNRGIIDGYTPNIINEFEKEKEIKLLDIDEEELVSLLNTLGATPDFNGFIDDIYLDFEDGRLSNGSEKISFRVRFKLDIDKKAAYVYITLKRKDKEESIELRCCFEKELLLKYPGLFFDLISREGLKPVRRKFKKRIGFVLGGLKYDIDDYVLNKKIPPLLEIEGPNSERVEGSIDTVTILQGKERLNGGSRKLFRHCGEEYTSLDDKSQILVPDYVSKGKWIK